MKIEKLKDTIQDCNINFLLGSGLSSPYLPLLGKIETLLTEVDNAPTINSANKKIIRASLYTRYFDTVIAKNVSILEGDPAAAPVLGQYKSFLHCLNCLLVKRKVTILSKEINLFTTNIDIFLEKALEELNLEYNDGFNGRFTPRFSLSNFKISRFKKSLHYDKSSELPVFNLMKLHGSLSWGIEAAESVIFSINLQHIRDVAAVHLSPGHVIDVQGEVTIATLVSACEGKKADGTTDRFMEAYEKLLIIVNPSKEKFRHTLMNQTYYELLRLYSNELEKENTVLFVMGFSFADEHIREITLRAANSNPTLMIYVIAHTTGAKTQIKAGLGDHIRNNNVDILTPEQEDDGKGNMADKFKYDFSTINEKLFTAVLRSVDADD